MSGLTSTGVTPTAWAVATVREIERSTSADGPTRGLVRLRLEVPDRAPHLPGQHYVIRLRAADGYTAQRSYSVASAPDDQLLEFLVAGLADGEVSGFLFDEARVGDVLEIRGPIGGWFTWSGGPEESPAVAIAGGSGVVPLVSMARHAASLGITDRLRLIIVARSWADLPYAAELRDHGAFIALTRENHGGRVAAPPYPDEVRDLVEDAMRAYVCGSVGFSSYATRLLGELGVLRTAIRVEQFGITG